VVLRVVGSDLRIGTVLGIAVLIHPVPDAGLYVAAGLQLADVSFIPAFFQDQVFVAKVLTRSVGPFKIKITRVELQQAELDIFAAVVVRIAVVELQRVLVIPQREFDIAGSGILGLWFFAFRKIIFFMKILPKAAP